MGVVAVEQRVLDQLDGDLGGCDDADGERQDATWGAREGGR
jgi:hypothetical protein